MNLIILRRNSKDLRLKPSMPERVSFVEPVFIVKIVAVGLQHTKLVGLRIVFDFRANDL